MRDHSKHIEVSRDQAISLLVDESCFKPRIEEVPIVQACGRVLAEDVVAQVDMPNCLTCKMDSVAVRWADFEQGMPDTTTWQRGREWQFANTGIGMPEGYDTAIVVEHVLLSDDESSISFDAAPSARFAGTRPAGSTFRAGDVLVPAHTMLTPLLTAHAASGNNASVRVIARPCVAFIPTGNELVAPGGPVKRGANIETNSLLVAAKIREWGGEAQVFDIVPDDCDLIVQAIKKACEQADIVVLNAGSSKGSDDWNVEMLDEIGHVLYHQTNHGPGHHSSGAVVDGVPVVGISGPPGGVAFTTDFYLKPLMNKWLEQDTEPVRLRVRLAQAFRKGGPGGPITDKRVLHGEDKPLEAPAGAQFFGVKQVELQQGKDGVIEATPTKSGKPGPTEAEAANAYFLLDGSKPSPEAGDFIEIELRS